MAALRPVIAITTGEPAGIGPDIALMMLQRRQLWRGCSVVLIGDANLLQVRARRLGLDGDTLFKGVEFGHVPLCAKVRPGHLDPANAPYVLSTLDAAIAGCQSGTFSAMVTAPIHKGVINDGAAAGAPKFTGHTEYLAEKTGCSRVVMLLVGPRTATAAGSRGTTPLRVALATTHLPLKSVPAALDRTMLRETLRILERDLQSKFGVPHPRILVAGLNPHAGESGHLGTEELKTIAPVIASLRQQGMHVSGPYPADTLFTPHLLDQGDAVLAMYHDQGLPVLKYASFGQGVNVTLGLPLIRTSVDHGTALDLAVSAARVRTADAGSLAEAFTLARQLVATASLHGQRRSRPRLQHKTG